MVKHIAILVGCFLLATSLMAQESIVEDSLLTDTTVPKYQFYVSPIYNIQQFSGTSASFLGTTVGLRYRNHLEIDAYYTFILNDFKKQIIFPNYFRYEQSNIGLTINYLFTTNSVRPFVGIGISLNKAEWHSEGGVDDVFSSNMFTLSPRVGGVWDVRPSFSIKADVGYDFVDESELVGISAGDLTGWGLNLAIKIRIFSFS